MLDEDDNCKELFLGDAIPMFQFAQGAISIHHIHVHPVNGIGQCQSQCYLHLCPGRMVEHGLGKARTGAEVRRWHIVCQSMQADISLSMRQMQFSWSVYGEALQYQQTWSESPIVICQAKEVLYIMPAGRGRPGCNLER